MSDNSLFPEEEEELIDLTKKLVSIPSSSKDDDSIYRYVKEYLVRRGADTSSQKIQNPYDPNNLCRNIYSRAGTGEGPRIMINCHLDTVGLTDGWYHSPYGAEEMDGKIFGLGAADMKGGCAAAIAAYLAFLQRKQEPSGELFLTCVYGEEAPHSFGSDSLLREFDLNDTDLIIVTEPSPLLAIYDYCTIHKKIHRARYPVPIVGAEGRVIFEIDFQGKASHASHPSQGINALHDAAKVITELARFDLFSNIKMGRGHYVVLNIDGGDQSFTVPARCRIMVNRQLILGETDKTVVRELKQIIKSLKISSKVSIQKRHSPSPDLEYRPYFSDTNEYMQKFLDMLSRSENGRKPPCTFASSSVGDFNLFGTRTKSPVLVFGPGGGNIHSPDEYVNTEEVIATSNHLLNYFMEVF